jgi:hypothetical protein
MRQDAIFADVPGGGTDPLAFVTKDSNVGLSQAQVINGAQGQCKIYLLPADTISLSLGDYAYDVRVDVGGNTYTVVRDTLKLRGNITRPLP